MSLSCSLNVPFYRLVWHFADGSLRRLYLSNKETNPRSGSQQGQAGGRHRIIKTQRFIDRTGAKVAALVGDSLNDRGGYNVIRPRRFAYPSRSLQDSG